MAVEVVNTGTARTQMSSLLRRVERGEEIVITRAGRPIAKLIPYAVERPKRIFGRLKGQIVIRGDFDADNDEIERDFEESINRPWS